MPPCSAIVILNPSSGSSGGDFKEKVDHALRAQRVAFEIWETTPRISAGVLAQRAVVSGAQHIIACGGDGTIMSVVNGLGEVLQSSERASPILSIIPGGTANLLAGALGIPSHVEEAVAIAVGGQDRTIDLGRCGEVLFALGIGLGLTEKLVSQASAAEKEKLGKWAYAVAMLRELGTRPTRFSFKLDGGHERTQRGVAIVVANAGRIGGSLHFAPDAEMDDGVLDQAKRIEICAEPPLDLQIDGEVVDMTTPLETEVLPRILTVRVPREAVSEIS
jgi:YegS/Rv2252/BmrU family lipid kinase